MANTYTWIIPQLECYPQKDNLSNVVFMVHWRRQATDGHNTVDSYGTQAIALAAEAPFTPYDALTFSQVCGWLINTMGDAAIAEIDANLTARLAEFTSPSIIELAPPWDITP